MTTRPDELIIDIELPTGGIRSNVRMHVSPDGTDQTVLALQERGWPGFEHPLPKIFFEWARRLPGVIADIGANTGVYALLGTFASMKNEVLAFEPHPTVFGALLSNLNANYGHRITALPLAVSDMPGRAKLYVPPQGHGLVETSSSLECGFKEQHSAILDVEVTTVDAVIKDRLSAGQRVTLIKVDIEGHEWPAISGAGWTVHRYRPILFVEVLAQAALPFLSLYLREHSYLDVPLLPQGRLAAYGTVEYHPDAWNHAFVPQETLSDFLAT